MTEPDPREQALADFREGVDDLIYSIQQRIDDGEAERALDAEIGRRRMDRGLWRTGLAELVCRARGHRWERLRRPVLIRAWCRRCLDLQAWPQLTEEEVRRP